MENLKNDNSVNLDDGDASSSCDLDACFWLPPEPEDCYDDMEVSLANYDKGHDDLNLGKPTSSVSLGCGGSGNNKFKEERQNLLDDVMDRKLKPLVNELLNSSGVVSSGKEGDNWVDIITSLSLEAASFLKPNATEVMNPNRYLKIKCIATGSCSQSQFFPGLVFNKQAAHKHMRTKYNNPRLLLIQGELGLPSNELSVFDSIRKDLERMQSIIDMIKKYKPNVVLVEKSVSRDIQEYVLGNGLTLVFDMKPHRLERVAHYTGSSTISSEILGVQKLGQCDSFHFEKFVEEHATSAECEKRPTKTLMFIRGCSTRGGCTILLMGTDSHELKKVKYVVRCAATMAYNLILETSFLLDQKAMFSTIPLSQVVNSVVTDEKHSVSAGQQIVPTIEEPIAETHSSVVNDIPCSSSFGGEISHNLKAEDHTQTDGQVSHGQEVADVEHRTTLSDKERTPEKEQQHCPLLSLEESLGNPDEEVCSKDNMSSSLDSESILVMMSSWNAKKGTKCEDSHASRIKFYQDTDIPLGKFLQDNLLNQKLQCWNCGETPEGHIFQYAHKGKLLTIQVHSLVDKSLPGESEGKLWMWSRYKCIYQDGGSKTTKRILMSSGSRGFSFGKFLQLSFSDSSLSSRLSSCSHSFHGDFLYFFGLGSVVATFKCSAVPTYSVSLPPLKLEFSSSIKEEFHKNIFEDVYLKGIRMFLDVEKALKAIEFRFNGTTLNLQGSALELSEVDKMLKEERSHFEIAIQNAEKEEGVYKFLCLNGIQLDLLLESCIWDRRLHSLMSSDCTDPETIDQKHGTLAATKTMKQQDRGNAKEDAKCAGLNLQRDVAGASYFDSQRGRTLSAILSNIGNDKGWWTPFPDIRCEYIKNLQRGYTTRLGSVATHGVQTIARELTTEEGAMLHIPLGSDKYIVSDYEDEFSSIIACALALLKDLPVESQDHEAESCSSSLDELDLFDSLVSLTAVHPEVSMGTLLGKHKYSVICPYAGKFRHLRDHCCPSEVDYIASLSRCRSWNPKGRKSNSLLAKTLDGRFIIKEFKRNELDSFLKFAPNYFEYMDQCIEDGRKTCLAKILGIYQVMVRPTTGGEETRHDFMVMENMFFGKNIIRQYELKGTLHGRFNSADNGTEAVLLDQNFVNDMNVYPIYVAKSSHRMKRAVWNDSAFLNSINVMDYSLLVGMDTQGNTLVCGIIDYARQYTWGKQFLNSFKSSLGVPENILPAVISPKEYKKRFRKFIDKHFPTVPEHW